MDFLFFRNMSNFKPMSRVVGAPFVEPAAQPTVLIVSPQHGLYAHSSRLTSFL